MTARPTIHIGIYGPDVSAGEKNGCGLWPAGVSAAITASEAEPQFLPEASERSWGEVLEGIHGVVLIGHGANYITRHLPGGVRILLIAPKAARVAALARQFGLSNADAAKRLAQMERLRREFLNRFCVGFNADPERFAATFNTAALPEETLIRCMVPLAAEIQAPAPSGT